MENITRITLFNFCTCGLRTKSFKRQCYRDNTSSSSNHDCSNNTSSTNKQEATEALPKDGEATYKLEKIGGTTILQYFFKDDIVYKQIGIYFYNPKGLGKSEEEVVQLLNKSQELYKDVTGIISKVEKKDGEYIQTVIYDYQTIDWKELHRRDPNQFPATKPKPVKISEAAAKLQEKGYVEYTE